MEFLISFIWLSFALVLGKLLRNWISIFRKLFIPASILGGFFLLFISPGVLGKLTNGFNILPEFAVGIWSSFPGFLINVIFACLFLGKKIPKLKEVWKKAGPQIIFGHIIAWGQYLFGFLVTLLVLIPLFKVEPMFGALIEIGFIGGHGTAAGLGQTFNDVGWHQGQELALGVATVGILLGVISGIFLINWGVKKGHTKFLKSETKKDKEIEGASKKQETSETNLTQEKIDNNISKKVVDKIMFKIESIEPLSFHLAYIGIAIGIGAIFLSIIVWLEKVFLLPLGFPVLFGYIPLFPLAMFGGIIVEKLHYLFFKGNLDRDLFLKVQGTALDFLIVSALGSLALNALIGAWLPLLILIIIGVIWTIVAFLFFAPSIFGEYWF